MAITDEEKRILDEWPVITREELLRINQYFKHYLFWRKEKWDGGILWRIACSCCGKRLELQEPRRIETPEEREFLGSLAHREKTRCPWCGADVTMISLSRAGKRKNLTSGTRLILLHNRDGILYADALEPYKLYDTDKDLTAVPRHWLLQRYRFTPGEVMEADYQLGEFAYSPAKTVIPKITYERGTLGKERKVTEPFKVNHMNSYRCMPYGVLNPEALDDNPNYRYCAYFTHWEKRIVKYDFISYMTAYSLYPRQMEMMAKTGLRKPILDLLRFRRKNAKYMDWNAPDIRDAFHLDKREIREFLTDCAEIECLPSYRKLKEAGMPVTFRELRQIYHVFGLTWMERCVEYMIRYSLTWTRLEHYLTKEYKASHAYAQVVFVEWWCDYINAAEQLGLDLHNDIYLLPRDLQRRHDERTAALMSIEEREADAASRERERARYAELAGRYAFSDERYLIRPPVSASEIVHEGKELRHCVGGYAARHVAGVATILFLRDRKCPDVPLVTIEMDGDRIVQIHGFENDRTPCRTNELCQSPMELYRMFLVKWTGWLKEGSERDADGCPVLPQSGCGMSVRPAIENRAAPQ